MINKLLFKLILFIIVSYLLTLPLFFTFGLLGKITILPIMSVLLISIGVNTLRKQYF